MKHTLFLLLAAGLLVACALSSPSPAAHPCGDGRCDAVEQAHPGLCPEDCATSAPATVAVPGATASPAPTAAPTETPLASPAGYITFVVNVHDWVHVDESAATVMRLADLFARYGVRGDFYFTAPVVHAYVDQYPEVIQRLQQTGMTISYHVRAPHPLTAGFSQPLEGLSGDELYQAIRDYETYRLDMTTGGLDRTQPGGYTYVARTFQTAPVAVAGSAGPQYMETAYRVYTDLGALMVVLNHESGTSIEQPFQYVQGLLARPVDFSVTRVDLGEGKQNFWWNLVTGPQAAAYQPVNLLQQGLAAWQAADYPRPPFVLAHIHENNFYRSGSVAWGSFYYNIDQRGNKTDPLAPPFDLSAPDPSTPRSAAEQEAIWQAYEGMVAYAATHLQVVTSIDIVSRIAYER